MPLPMLVHVTTDADSEWTCGYAFFNDDGTAADLSTATFELVIRPDVTDQTEPALVSISTTAGAQGYITVSGNVATAVIEAPATAALGEGARPYALWLNPGTPGQQTVVRGQFTTQLVAVP